MTAFKIGIAGGTGDMGRWFENIFSGLGHEVLIAGRKTDLTYNDLAKHCDVVILSMPVTAAVEVAGVVGPQMRPGQLLMDFCSQKEPIVKAMADHTPADVIGTHPMFGPHTAALKGQNIILCTARDNSGWTSWLETFFTENQAVVTRMQPEEHDRKMALSQSLMHFLTVSLGRLLQEMDIPPDQAFLFSTPIFRLNVDLIGRLFSQDLDLYAELVRDNKYATEIVDRFSAAMDENRQHFFEGSDTDLMAYLEDLREFIGSRFCENALTETTRALDAMYLGDGADIKKQTS
ncbi:MAG: prephenate dehydrogenase/arogenate dehydrogenase family protein [Thermodesulfobacteriota bacterium]|nr:prephenate dehydrogenase/arogenate dehydrogenase family protein [Thermodesulfobacteriota bacterium]